MAVITPRGKHKQKVHSRGSHSGQGGQDPEPPVILIAVLMLHIRDMKRTDTEVCDDEHLLTEGGKPESEDPAVLRAGKMHGKKREYDSRQRIYCAADRIPQIVFFKCFILIHDDPVSRRKALSRSFSLSSSEGWIPASGAYTGWHSSA